MPNLVGIGNSQVPTNAMLGGLAYRDTVGEINLDKIKAKTSDTAVDIFVYDTSKDSDGGAWRKKATKQSWYNENVSERRGARKEFPAVAVIVVQSSYVTIYDGDDPNLPMWMEFTVNNNPAQIIFTNPTVAHMLNGVLVVGTNPNATDNDYWDGGIKVFNFISDKIRSYSLARSMIYDMNISQRNDPKVIRYDTTNVLVSPNVSAVTMFVLPNTKIDVNTGLPIPTILAATRKGISVVKDSGVVFDMAVSVGGGSNYQTNSIEITKDLKIIHNWDDRASNAYSSISIIPLSLLESDSSYGYEYQFRNEGTYGYNVGGNSLDIFNAIATYFVDAVPTELGYFAIGSNKGLVNVQHIPMALNNGGRHSLGDARFSGGMHCRITNDFNTGWMYNDIKGAFLSDTDDTDITGSELITNGTFAANSNWTFQGAGAGWSISSGKLNYDGSGLLYHKAYQNITGLTVGQTYVLSIDVISLSSHSISFAFATTSIGTTLLANTVSTTGTHSITYTATQANISVYVQTNHATQTFSVDNFSLRIAEEDRSVNQKGLQVFGTINKNPVATGAELVSYGGFSASNYLQQPYNSDLNFGTGDLSIIFWYKLTSTGTPQCFIHRGDGGSGTWGSGAIIQIEMDSSHLELQLAASGFSSFDQVQVPIAQSATGEWQHFVGVREGGRMHVYIDGVKYGNVASTRDLSNTSAKLWVGQRPTSSRPLSNGSMALLRMSSTAPSAEQVKKIYDDEKCLFHENAKCTLHGTSDDVKALAFDDTTNVLHVGTSSGRSEFQGLNRINNTTTAVTTAISVSNEFVAEQ